MKNKIVLFIAPLMFLASACGASHEASTSQQVVPVQVVIATPIQKPDFVAGDLQEKILTASQSFSVSVTGTGISLPLTGTANKTGSGTTVITLQIPVGTARTFTAKAFDAVSGSGSEISFGTVTQDIVGGVNNVNMTLNAIPRAIVSPASAVATAGSGSTLTFGVNDADGVAISNTPTTLVTWAVVGGAANGTISTAGVYTPPAVNPTAPTPSTITVRATSAVDATVPALSATLTLN